MALTLAILNKDGCPRITQRVSGMFSLWIRISKHLKCCHQKILVWINRGKYIPARYKYHQLLDAWWWIKKHFPSDLSLSTITLSEILYGIEKSPVKKEERRLKIQRFPPFSDSGRSQPASCALSVSLFRPDMFFHG